MMHSMCNGYHVTDGSCSCGWFYNPNNSLSMMTPSHNSFEDVDGDMYHYNSSSSSSSSVDCTLSLGTPSTRLSDNNIVTEKKRSKFCSWNFLQPSKSHESSSSSSLKNNRNASNSYSGNNGDNHPVRRCANCDTTSTPLWRNGPKGPKSLCNACGIRYKKEERRAAAAAAATAAGNNCDSAGNAAGAWVHYSQNQKMPYVSSAYGNDFSFIEDQNIDDSGNPFLSWSLNVH